MKSNMNNMNIPLFIFIIKKGMYHQPSNLSGFNFNFISNDFFLKEFEIFLIIT